MYKFIVKYNFKNKNSKPLFKGVKIVTIIAKDYITNKGIEDVLQREFMSELVITDIIEIK